MASFFSLGGQLERIKSAVTSVAAVSQNIASTLTLGLVPKSDVTFTGNKLAVAVANNPLTTAALIAPGVSALGAGKLAGVTGKVASTVKSTLSSAFSSLSPTTKVASIVAAPIVASAVLKSPTLQAKVIEAPSALTNVGGNIGRFIENPSLSSATTIFKENPIVTSGLAAAGVAVAGLGTAGIAASLLNTSAIKQQTETTLSPGDALFKQLQDQYEQQKKASEELAKVQAKDQSKALEAQTEAIKIQAEAALALEKEKTKQVELLSKAQPVSTPSAPQTAPVAAATKKVTKKKAKKKKKAKPKPKKKAKKKKKYKKKKK